MRRTIPRLPTDTNLTAGTETWQRFFFSNLKNRHYYFNEEEQEQGGSRAAKEIFDPHKELKGQKLCSIDQKWAGKPIFSTIIDRTPLF